MNLGADGLVPILVRTTALLTLSVVAVRALLGRVRLASPALWRLACVLALLQGVLIVRFSVPVPWAGRITSHAAPAPPFFAKAAPEALHDPATQTASSQERLQGTGVVSNAAASLTWNEGKPLVDRARASWSGLVGAGWLVGMAVLPAVLLIAARRATLRGHLNSVRALRISRDGRWLVSASTDLTALVWDLARALDGREAN
jgi:hypothetical protein